MRRGLACALVAVLMGGTPSAWGVVIVSNGDTFVDKSSGATNENSLGYIAIRTSGTTAGLPDPQPPREFSFIQFALGSNSASDVALSVTTVNTSNGARTIGGYLFAKVNSFTETTLTFDNSFLGGAGGIATTDGSFGQVATFITNAGWTQLDTGAGTNALFKLGSGVQNTTYSTNPVELKNFYNANPGATITILFESGFPTNGNEERWTDRLTATPPRLTVTEVPEPTTLLLLTVGGLLLRRRSAPFEPKLSSVSPFGA